MSFPLRNSNTKINELRENIDSEYGEELKLNIRCDEDDNHIAVLYCPDCKANLCRICFDKIHSSKILSKHEVVRLTQKPEPPIYCHLHPQKIAELVCKEPNCEGINQPVCTMCHQYKKHKDHKYEILEDEYEKIQLKIANCLEEVERKQAACDKNVDDYDKCISTYSSADTGFWNTERDKIDKFYFDGRTLALKTFDDFTNNRIETLKLLQNQYINDKTKLNNMSSELRNIKEMKKLEVIKSGENVEKMIIQAGKNIDEPTDLIPSKNCNITYPNVELMNIKLSNNHNINSLKIEDILKSPDYSLDEIFESSVFWTDEDENNGKLYKYEDGGSIIRLENEPNNYTADSSQYKYICVIHSWRRENEFVRNRLGDHMRNNWWSRIFVSIDDFFGEWDYEDFVNEVQEIAKSDKRVVVFFHKDKWEIINHILES